MTDEKKPTEKLPKALSEQQRRKLVHYSQETGPVALALIDAQAALLAEYAAQAVVDGQRIAEAEEAWGQARLMKRAEAAEARIAELERCNANQTELILAQGDRFAAASSLLERCNGQIYTGEAHGRQLAHDIRDHLSGQPAAPADHGPDHGEADPDYPPHVAHFAAPARTEDAK
jgi:hypothetical protein